MKITYSFFLEVVFILCFLTTGIAKADYVNITVAPGVDYSYNVFTPWGKYMVKDIDGRIWVGTEREYDKGLADSRVRELGDKIIGQNNKGSIVANNKGLNVLIGNDTLYDVSLGIRMPERKSSNIVLSTIGWQASINNIKVAVVIGGKTYYPADKIEIKHANYHQVLFKVSIEDINKPVKVFFFEKNKTPQVINARSFVDEEYYGLKDLYEGKSKDDDSGLSKGKVLEQDEIDLINYLKNLNSSLPDIRAPMASTIKVHLCYLPSATIGLDEDYPVDVIKLILSDKQYPNNSNPYPFNYDRTIYKVKSKIIFSKTNPCIDVDAVLEQNPTNESTPRKGEKVRSIDAYYFEKKVAMDYDSGDITIYGAVE